MGIVFIRFVDLLFQALYVIIFIRILLTWFPQINWYNQPFAFLKQVSDPILLPFRAIIPPFGGLDFSPIVALLFLSIIQEVFVRAAALLS